MIRFKCVSCGSVLQVGKEKVGHVDVCPNCGTRVRVPVAKAKTASAQQASAATGVSNGVSNTRRSEEVQATEPPPIPRSTNSSSHAPLPPEQQRNVAPRPHQFRDSVMCIFAMIAILVLLSAFFFPWVRVFQSDYSAASGLQLAVGTSTCYEEGEVTRSSKQREFNETIGTRPWYFLGLLLPVCLGACFAMFWLGALSPTRAGATITALGLLGIVGTMLATGVDYTSDVYAAAIDSRIEHVEERMKERLQELEKQGRESDVNDYKEETREDIEDLKNDTWDEMQNRYNVEATGTFATTLSTVLYAVMVGFGIMVLIGGNVDAVRKARHALASRYSSPPGTDRNESSGAEARQ